MGRYIDWQHIVDRYPSLNTKGGASETSSAWIYPVEFQIDGMLAPEYSAPFSSNNETVKDLCIELAYIRMGNISLKDKKELKDDFRDRIKRLKSGMESMMTTSGDLIGSVGDTIWSSTEDYHTIFDLGSVENWATDSSQIDDIDNGKL